MPQVELRIFGMLAADRYRTGGCGDSFQQGGFSRPVYPHKEGNRGVKIELFQFVEYRDIEGKALLIHAEAVDWHRSQPKPVIRVFGILCGG